MRATTSPTSPAATTRPHDHTTNKVLIQRVSHHEVRELFGLSANLAIRAIARVCAALKVPEKAHSAFKPTSIDHDARIFSFRESDSEPELTAAGEDSDRPGRLAAPWLRSPLSLPLFASSRRLHRLPGIASGCPQAARIPEAAVDLKARLLERLDRGDKRTSAGMTAPFRTRAG